MFGIRKRYIKKFLRDTEGLVTVQVVLFSVMLFGGIGLMMDFGRAYSAHSHMQSYVDQVALAAARELDQSPSAIQRATTAADAVAGSSSFTESGDFNYSEIAFLTGAPTDANGNFDESMLSTLNTGNSLEATHVLVKSSNESVALQLLNFANRDGEGITEIALRTQAVATSRRVACGGLSPLVMCNPFEDNSAVSFREEMAEGYRMHLTADVTDQSRPQSDTDKIRLGLLKNPHETMHVEVLRDICLLATVDTGLSCINDQVVFKAADPYSVTTGLNVLFDIYDDSMADIMNIGNDQPFDSPFPATLGQSINRSSLFYPDRAANRHRMDRQHYKQMVDEEIFRLEFHTQVEIAALEAAAAELPPTTTEIVDPTCTLPTAHPLYTALCVTVITEPGVADPEAIADLEEARDEQIAMQQAKLAAYPASDAPSTYSRVNYIHETSPSNTWGPAHATNDCLENSPGCSLHTEIDNSAVGGNDIDSFVTAFYQPYFLRKLAEASGELWYSDADITVTYEDGNDYTGPISTHVDVDALYPAGNYTSYYQLYKHVESQTADIQSFTSSLGTAYEPPTDPAVAAFPTGSDIDITDADQIEQFNKIANGGFEYGLRSSPDNFAAVYGSGAIGTEERRRKRVTVVNCSAAKTYSEVTGSGASNYGDAYVGDVVDVVDMFLIEMPTVTGCKDSAADFGTDPFGNLPCTNAEVASVELHAEFIDSASSSPLNFDSRTFAVLVH